jgi:hypothetical protein
MATPKIDRLVTSFCKRINDPATFQTSVLQDGDILTANEVMEYINKAMFELFRKYWELVKGDKQKFIQIFPELVKTRYVDFTFDTSEALHRTIYTIANPNLDYYCLVDASHQATKYIQVLPENLYNTVLTGKVPQYIPTETKPVIIAINKILNVFPRTINESGGLTAVLLNIVVQPLNPTDGSFLTQNGSYDSPYYDTWNDEIVNIAVEMFLQDTQES